MNGRRYSLILLPTLSCNADCDYCFADQAKDGMPLENVGVLVRKVLDHMGRNDFESLTIHWQGGEVMTLAPHWFEQAFEIIAALAESSGRQITNCIQSNMMGYHGGWNKVLAEMFGNSVGSSLDYPNLHRKMPGGHPGDYNRKWIEKMHAAKGAGIDIGVISIPNEETFNIGAERFYAYFVEEIGITDFQVNTPFPGGQANDVKKTLPLDCRRLGQFLCRLCDTWIERGLDKNVSIGPFDQLVAYFLHENPNLACIWGENCANDFICIDPAGNVSQCDCWAASYPRFRFGNIFGNQSLSTILETSPARRRFLKRPISLVAHEECISCDYLSLCHGGCPIRTYSVYGSLERKDPYCEAYKMLFKHTENVAARIARDRCIPLHRSGL